MRTIELDGYSFELRNKREVTNQACEYVEELVQRVFFDPLDLPSIFGTKGKKSDEALTRELLKDKSRLFKLLRISQGENNFFEGLCGVILATNICDYELLTSKYPRATLIDLIKESEQEIGGFRDISAGFMLNIPLKLDMSSVIESAAKGV
jgi:hypothetical protein